MPHQLTSGNRGLGSYAVFCIREITGLVTSGLLREDSSYDWKRRTILLSAAWPDCCSAQCSASVGLCAPYTIPDCCPQDRPSMIPERFIGQPDPGSDRLMSSVPQTVLSRGNLTNTSSTTTTYMEWSGIRCR